MKAKTIRLIKEAIREDASLTSVDSATLGRASYDINMAAVAVDDAHAEEGIPCPHDVALTGVDMRTPQDMLDDMHAAEEWDAMARRRDVENE